MKRVRGLVFMFIVRIATVVAVGMQKSLSVFTIASLCALGLMFFLVIALHLEIMRINDRATLGASDDYRLFYIICCVLSAAFSFLPVYLAPVMIFPLILMGIFKNITGFALSIYFALDCALLSGAAKTEIICLILTVTFAALLISLQGKERDKKYLSFFFIPISVVIPTVMSYMDTGDIDFLHMTVFLFEGLVLALIYMFFNEKLSSLAPKAVYVKYETILDDSYHLVRDIRNYSSAEYDHAKKVSDICYRIADALGFDRLLAKAGGFYYRLGRMQGEPFIANGIALAKDNSFPPELIDIIAEYDGKENFPSSKESALVHIIDTIALRFEVMDRDTFSGNWNRDIMIYSTMNEYSETGMYDMSGLSMNQFLKIRDLLTREDLT